MAKKVKVGKISDKRKGHNYLTLLDFFPRIRNEAGKLMNESGRYLCECGNIHIAEVYSVSVNNIRSCGCFQKQRLLESTTKHGLVTHKLYAVLKGIKARCYNPNTATYNRYGQRGISVYNEWLDKENGMTAFHDWCISNGWKEGLELDRIDNDGNYEPGNCRFVTKQRNLQNTSRTKLDESKVRYIRNSKKNNKELSIELSINISTISAARRGLTWKNIK